MTLQACSAAQAHTHTHVRAHTHTHTREGGRERGGTGLRMSLSYHLYFFFLVRRSYNLFARNFMRRHSLFYISPQTTFGELQDMLRNEPHSSYPLIDNPGEMGGWGWEGRLGGMAGIREVRRGGWDGGVGETLCCHVCSGQGAPGLHPTRVPCRLAEAAPSTSTGPQEENPG